MNDVVDLAAKHHKAVLDSMRTSKEVYIEAGVAADTALAHLGSQHEPFISCYVKTAFTVKPSDSPVIELRQVYSNCRAGAG